MSLLQATRSGVDGYNYVRIQLERLLPCLQVPVIPVLPLNKPRSPNLTKQTTMVFQKLVS
jgi:hypothetical protein